MNHLLLHPDELSGGDSPGISTGATALLQPSTCDDAARRLRSEERLRHLRKVLRAEPGDRLRVGVLGGPVGEVEVAEIARDRVLLRLLHLDEAPPARADLHLALALPRPKFIGRILQMVATCGIRRLTLIGSARVEASFWDSSVLLPDSVERHLILGLEQARDTVLPEVVAERSFEATLSMLKGARECGPVLLAHGGERVRRFPATLAPGATVLVGPEGGWLDGEVKQLEGIGAQVRTLGPRPLRVETAVAALLSRARY